MSKTCPYHNNPVPCKICGYTGETGEPSNHKSRKANDVLYNRLMMFVACVYGHSMGRVKNGDSFRQL